MFSLCTTLCRCLAIALFLITGGGGMTSAQAEELKPHIDLAISFNLETATLSGTTRVLIPPGTAISFDLSDLRITGILLNQADRENIPLMPAPGTVLAIPAHRSQQTLFISYERKVENTFLNSISDKAIVLTSGWHPVPDQKTTYALKVQLPQGFTAVSESDFFPGRQEKGSVSFAFSQPVYALTFAAAPYEIEERLVRDGLKVYTLFFKEEKELAEGYLDSAADYITRYEKSIGPFPFNHYVIVENTKPTGFGLPTFTLLGRQVIRLPFIRETSLGHEILHSWFGNSVSIAEHSGNWCEGLTTYLADLAYREETGEGAQARKETIQNYLNYVRPSTSPLHDFKSVGHDRIDNRGERAVGYGRSAMLFHELQRLTGNDIFSQSIRRFYREFRGRSASWTDLKDVFAQESKRDLDLFFSQRLDRIELPDLQISGLMTRQTPDKTILSFSLIQAQVEPFELMLDFTVRTISTTLHFTRQIDSSITKIDLALDSYPLELVIDPDYDIMRRLTPEERTPTWSGIIGAEHVTVVLARKEEKEIYQPFLDLAASSSYQVRDAADIGEDRLLAQDIIFLGTSSAQSRALFAEPRHPGTGLTVDVRFNPLDRDRTIALISSSSRSESKAAVYRLSHYGKYSFLHFQAGRIVDKFIAPSMEGIRFVLQEKPEGLAVSNVREFDRLLDQIEKYRVLYIGEQHTSRADHLLQLMLIEALYKRNRGLVIGMEMFPRSSQQALDDYINDPSITETSFLKNSRYYEVWGYDFRLFRPIFAFARKNRIPVIGLNIDRDIVSSLFKKGTTEGLTEEQIMALPRDRDLAMPGYRERLAGTLAVHDGTTRSSGSLAGFIQAQALWDESMAESIYRYLQDNPSAQMVVLAGSQHTRKDSGIPPRVARRMEITQATINNLATTPMDGRVSSTADYFFLLEAEDFPALGKIGIVLQQNAENDAHGMKIIEINPLSDAVSAGLKTGDILVAINGVNIETMEDVRRTMMERSAGETIQVVVRRIDEKGVSHEIPFTIRLFDPNAGKPHP